MSSSSVLVKLSSAEPLVVAMYRLAFSVLILAVPLVWQKQKQRMSRRDLGLAVISGIFLAAHFATWFFSLKLTSVASSAVLVNTHPFIVLLYGYFILHEPTRMQAWIGAALTVAGAVLISWGDFRLDATALLGDFLAFLGAVTVSGYYLIGRQLRQRLGALQYSVTVYACATAALLIASLAWGSPLTGFAPVNWWIFIGLAVFPTIFGHTLFNWALRFVPTSVISISVLGEPIGASLLAWIIWRTAPGPVSLAGGALILLGIGIFQWRSTTT
jgi:drug/metabolite transporter (DMT)-like permease